MSLGSASSERASSARVPWTGRQPAPGARRDRAGATLVRGWFALVAAVALAAPVAAGPAQDAGDPGLDLDAREGPLRNQCFVPVDEDAAERFAAGDRAWREGAVADALDAWRAAVAESPTGALVPWLGELDAAPAAGAAPRAFDGVEEALLARLALSSAAREEWRLRFHGVATAELSAAGGVPAALAGVERRLPATEGALRAALALGDTAFERGDALGARTWYARAARHAALGALADAESPDGGPWLARRRAAVARFAPPTPDPTASGVLGAGREVGLADEAGPPPPFPGQPLGAGMRAGAVAFGAERVLVQTATRLHLVDLASAAVVETIDPGALVGATLGVPPRAYPAEAPPGWELLPAHSRGRALVVVGRATAGRGRGNALARIAPGSAGEGDAADPTLARAEWAVMDDRLAAPDGSVLRPALLAGLEGVEFQPGPALLGDVAVAQTRVGAGELEAHLVAFDATTGAPRWRRYLAKGRELVADVGRFVADDGLRGAATPLATCGDAVFAGTQLGLGALVDALDGRVRWAVLNRRREPAQRGWTGTRAAAVPGGGPLAWAPADGEFLYWLPVGALARGPAGPFAAPPAPIGAGASLQAVVAGAAGPQALVLARAGQRTTLASWNARSGERREALHLLPGEPLREGLAVAGARVLVSSDRALYLFDRERDLLLLDREALSAPGAAPAGRWAGGGAVVLAGARAVVVGHDHVVVFDPR